MFNNLFNFASPKKLKEAGVLGMNARNYNFISKLNKRSLYPLVDDKVITKGLADKHQINTPKKIGIIEFQHEVKNILQILGDYKEFVIKPAQGSGGKGVLVIKNYDGEIFTTASGRIITYNEVYQHISNILSGLYSLGGKYDTALIEELVHFSDIFKDFSFQGVPDVRIIVYKGYPALTMMRLATKASGGRANLHQGAVGVGLDIQTGEALNAVMRNVPITHHPDTNAELKNLVVPFWREHLEIGAKAYDMTGLGYIGADIVLDKERGPMMLELNARPGLAIQIANGIGLQKVLENIEKNYPKNLNAQERVDFVLNHKK
ncbi:MAG: alpha-L-glutamate ligase-like protein [Alphaproteobacteria bacterium]|nr:alpha-L-glutamate ligase-like protein [Alphaproteobacteria bacterium]